APVSSSTPPRARGRSFFPPDRRDGSTRGLFPWPDDGLGCGKPFAWSGTGVGSSIWDFGSVEELIDPHPTAIECHLFKVKVQLHTAGLVGDPNLIKRVLGTQ